jgi:hypothetical protein
MKQRGGKKNVTDIDVLKCQFDWYICANLPGNVEWLTPVVIVHTVQNRNTIMLQLPNQEITVRSILGNE